MRDLRIHLRVVCSALLLLGVAVPFAASPATWAAPRIPPTPADAGRDEHESVCDAFQAYYSHPAECAFQDEQAQRAKLGLPPLPQPPIWDCLYPSSPTVVIYGWSEECRLWRERTEAARQASPPPPNPDTTSSSGPSGSPGTSNVGNPDQQATLCMENKLAAGSAFPDALEACKEQLAAAAGPAPAAGPHAQGSSTDETIKSDALIGDAVIREGSEDAAAYNATPIQAVAPPPGVSPPAQPAASTPCPPKTSGVDILWASATPADLVTATFNEFGALWGDVVASVADWCPCDGGGKKDKDKDKDQDKDHKKEQEKEQEEKKRAEEKQKKEDEEHKRAEEEAKQKLEAEKQQQQAGVPC